MKVIDATGLILGRLATNVAKLALEGETITLINCSKAVISGSKKDILSRLNKKRLIGGPFHGPFYPRTPEAIVKRAIRGMLPYKSDRGRRALKRIKCYTTLPTNFKAENIETIKEASKDKLVSARAVTIAEVSRLLGAKV